MSAAWEYLNKVAEDSAVATVCRSDDPQHCRVHGHPEPSLKYEFEVWGVNSVREKIKTTAPSFMKAISNARFRGANGNRYRTKDVHVKWLSTNGIKPKKNVIIPAGEDLRANYIQGLDVGIRRHFDGLRSAGPHAGSGGGADGHQDRLEDAQRGGAQGVSGEVQKGPGNEPGPRVSDGGDSGKRLKQGEFQFDEARGKVLRYLEATAEDAWVDSGDGNFAWKPSKRKTPFDRLPRKQIQEIISENVSLIKTIDADMLPKVASRVYRVLAGRLDPYKFVAWLENDCDVSEARAYLIATDQIRKAKERIKIADWIARGIKFAVWRHKDGSKDPRKYHMRKWDGKSGIRSGRPNGLDGFPFRLKDPPVIDKKTGERGYPSTLIGCKCYITGVRA